MRNSAMYQPVSMRNQIPRPVWNICVHFVQLHDSTVAEYEEMVDAFGFNDGQPKSNLKTSPTEQKALRRLEMEKRIKAVEDAINVLEEPYKTAVWENVAYNVPYPMIADKDTWSRKKSAFIYALAKNLYLC